MIMAMFFWLAFADGTDNLEKQVEAGENLEMVRDQLVAKVDGGAIAEKEMALLMRTLNKLGDFENGKKMGKVARQKFPQNPEVFYRSSVAIQQSLANNPMGWMSAKGKYLKYLDHAIELKPDYVAAYWAAAGFHMSAPAMIGASKKKAHEYAAQLKGHVPKHGLKIHAAVYRAAKDADGWKKCFAELESTWPEDADIYADHAVYLVGAKEYDAARAKLAKALEIDPNNKKAKGVKVPEE